MLNVMISGCNGKMGKEVANEIDSFENLLLVSGFSFQYACSNTFPVYNDISQISTPPSVIIDFSFPDCTLEILKYAISKKIPIVIGTTGFSEKQSLLIKQASNTIPVFQSSNMSFSIKLMEEIASKVASILPNTDIEIIETHHHNKIDAPSGTALSLANAINSALPYNATYNFNRHDLKQKRSPHEIGFSSIRGGNIVGEHTVKFFSDYETFEITHTTYSKKVFAQGALKAAEFIVKQTPGLYANVTTHNTPILI